MASPQAGTSSAWVVEVEKTLEAANAKAARRRRHSVYRVPAHVKNLNNKAYQPQVVSLGPFHHGDPDLLPTEEHKRRAVWHRLRRAGKTLEQFAAAVEEVALQLEDAYQDLGSEWRGQGNRCRFMELMIMDGCFLLRSSETDSLHDISFHRGVLSLPTIAVDESTEYMFLNVMAFERLHVGTGNSVTAYVFLMSALVTSTRDVALLSARGIIQSAVGTDHAVAKLFGSLAVDAVLEPDSELDAVHRMVNEFCRKPWNTWRANLLRTYFRDPWAWINVTAIVVFVMTIIQTIYTVLQYYHGNRS